MAFHEIVAIVSRAIETAGVGVMVIGSLVATFVSFGRRDGGSFEARFRAYRQWLGRSILLGLEFLVAADIIGTVTLDPTLMGVASLGAVVAIRTFLSLALAVEIEGRWPWRSEGASRK